MTPTDAATVDHPGLLRRAEELIAAGRLSAARPLLAALQKRGAPAADCAWLAARIALQEGRPAEARAILDPAIAQALGHTGLRKVRAQMLSELGDFGEAARDAAEAIIADPTDPQAKALLGGMMLALGHYAEARACLAEAAADAPGHAPYAQALAAAEEAEGDPLQAARTLQAGIQHAPANRALRTAAILLALRQGQPAAAYDLAEAARADGLVDACILGLTGHALSGIGRHEAAAEAYAEALKLAPKDGYVRRLVAAAGALPGAPRAPLPYVRAMFDTQAQRFEMATAAQGYRVPGLMRAAVQRHLPALRDASLLDLGCGTGFVALALSDLPFAVMRGVDASPAMLALAQSKRLYADLQEADLMERLSEDPARYDVITAADVLCYFGDLTPVFVGVRQRLLDGGLFIATVDTIVDTVAEDGPDRGPWRVGMDARYQHADSHVRSAAAAAGLRALEITPTTLRFQADQPIPGLLLVFGRQDD
jgi:predicted TPR repeat methyltransferase